MLGGAGMKKMKMLQGLALALLVSAGELGAQARVIKDIEFAKVGEASLKLDLYLPQGVESPSLVVWVHGGAWRRGSRESVPIAGLVTHGFAVASVDYRLTPVARFPAQVHDIKAAIRFLRAKAGELGVAADQVSIAGASAGGHLAALVGLSHGVEELEGEVGEHAGESSRVDAIASYYGPSNLMTILEQSTPHGLGVRIPALQLLLGDQPEEVPELARLASPVEHVDAEDPPLLLIHGDQDPQVPINQSHELVGRFIAMGKPATARLMVRHGAAHGGPGFYEPDQMRMLAGYLRAVLR